VEENNLNDDSPHPGRRVKGRDGAVTKDLEDSSKVGAKAEERGVCREKTMRCAFGEETISRESRRKSSTYNKPYYSNLVETKQEGEGGGKKKAPAPPDSRGGGGGGIRRRGASATFFVYKITF